LSIIRSGPKNRKKEVDRQTDRQTNKQTEENYERCIEKGFFSVFGTDRFNPDLERWRNGVVGFFSWW
jgi:hypothetical protein